MQLNPSRQVDFALAQIPACPRAEEGAKTAWWLLILWACFIALAGSNSAAEVATPSCQETLFRRTQTGQWGVPLSELAQFYASPNERGAGNHLFDMWEGKRLATYAQAAGLTNNRTLIVNSHAEARRWGREQHFALYPHESLLPSGQRVPYFCARDLAAFLGASTSAEVHNIVLAGCNLQGAFQSRAWLESFPNATNIIHAPSGEAGYQPMFLQLLFSHSSLIKPLYENRIRNDRGQTEFILESTPEGRSVRMGAYLAELYQPGADKPYRRQRAGRELLAPPAHDRRLAKAE